MGASLEEENSARGAQTVSLKTELPSVQLLFGERRLNALSVFQKRVSVFQIQKRVSVFQKTRVSVF